MLYYKDVIFPTSASRGRMLDDEGNLTDDARCASSGELGFARIAKAIVEEAWRLDDSLICKLKQMLDAS